MASNMKTTIDIPDALLQEAKQLAAQEGTTLKALVSEGLRRIVADRQKKETFRLRKVSYRGQGLQPHLAGTGWEGIRQMAYEGHGG